jgi:hypothetical protein
VEMTFSPSDKTLYVYYNPVGNKIEVTS